MRQVRFDSAILRLRYAVLGLEGANFGVSSSISGSDKPFVAPQQVAGSIRGGDAALTVADAPVSLPPVGARWTVERAEKAFQLAMGAVAFRDAGQRLTATGTWTITAARLGGPLLLALAVLAVRARVKR